MLNMNLFDYEEEKAKEFAALEFRNQRKSLRTLKQVGKTTVARDIVRKALAPGKRISASGKTYWETRKNRSDSPGKKL